MGNDAKVNKLSMANPAESHGCPRSPEVQRQGERAAGGRPLAIAWITDELIEEHRRVWSRRYGRIITESEAIEIIMNIKRFAETILDAMTEEGQP